MGGDNLLTYPNLHDDIVLKLNQTNAFEKKLKNANSST